MDTIRKIIDGHKRLKERIHSFRIPLSPNGRRFMTLVYFSIPLIGGYHIMEWAQSKANKKWNVVLENGKYVYKLPEEVTQRGARPDHELTLKEINIIKQHQYDKDAYIVSELDK